LRKTGGTSSSCFKEERLLHVARIGHSQRPLYSSYCGADVNARATLDEAGIGGQTAIFHAVTQFDDNGLPITQLLIERDADTVRAKLPGNYERPGEIVECTPLGYALRLAARSEETVTLLRERGRLSKSKTQIDEPARIAPSQSAQCPDRRPLT